MFAMNNMIYNEDLQARADSFGTLSIGLLVLSSFLCIIIAVVLGFANAFMLRLRKREFGTYLTLGMKRHQIVKLFLLENSFLGFFAILTGSIFGSLLYQCLMLLMSKLLLYDFSFTFLSVKGVLVTLLMVVAIFTVTFITSSIYLKRVTIFELIHGEKQVNKVQRKPFFSVVLTIVSAAAIAYALYKFSILLEAVLKGNTNSENELLISIILLAIAIITFHIGLAKSLMYVLLKSNKLQKGTNQFVLRQLSASLSSNAMLLGLLAFLISFAIIAANTGFLYKAVEEENIDKRYPFDVMGNEEAGTNPPVSFEEATRLIGQYTTIERSFETPFFTTGEVDFLKLTSWYNEGYTDKDTYMRVSDLNILLQAIGEEPITLEHEYAIYSNMGPIDSYDFSSQTISHHGKTYKLSHVKGILPALAWVYFVIVVPDEVVDGMQLAQTAYAVDLASMDFDTVALHQEFTYQIPMENYNIETSDYRIKSYQRAESMAFSAILIVGVLYMGFVFVLLALAILALKTLSTTSDDEKKYRILYRIGVSKSMQTATLAKQILLFFAFPIMVPILLALPVAIISEQFIQLLGLEEQLSMTSISVLIVTVIALIYSLYFVVTFSITKKHVLDHDRN